MDKQPTCKKCGRRLKSPMSIARGMGSKCAGISSTSGKSVRVRSKPRAGMAYTDTILRQVQAVFFPGELPTKNVSKRELVRRRREERRRMFETHESFQCGSLLPQHQPLIYVPLKDGNWKETPSGRVISHERLQEYLKRYRFI